MNITMCVYIYIHIDIHIDIHIQQLSGQTRSNPPPRERLASGGGGREVIPPVPAERFESFLKP